MSGAVSSRRAERVDGYLPIEEYAAIGDGRGFALVGSDGSIDWLSLPSIDSPSVLAAVLDVARGGRFELRPAVPFTSERRYLQRTNLLQTTFITDAGSVRVTDAFTIDQSQEFPWRELARRVEGLSGSVPMRWRLEPRFDYGRYPADFSVHDGAAVARQGALQLAIQAFDAGTPEMGAGTVTGAFEITEGRRATLAVQASEGQLLLLPRRDEVERRLDQTAAVWRSWVGHHNYDGPWREAVERSLLAIGLLADRRTGAIAAAGTTSLPEALGSERNFDYRFGWVRDLSFTLEALLSVGMEELAHKSLTWLLEATARTHPRIDPVYALNGEVVRDQRKLPLAGYRLASPVHVGNQAGSQLQLGGVGDLIETVCQYVRHGHILAPSLGERIADSAELLLALWPQADAGLWELGDYAQYATSKLSCWVAFDRVLELVRCGQVPPRNVAGWRAARDDIRSFIERELWSDREHSYLMRSDSEALDCGFLLAARRGYSDPAHERMSGTLEAVQRELTAGGPLLYRYSGMREQENAFLACSFWLVEALALGGRREQAAEVMDAMAALGNEVGLYSEEMEPESRAMRGNFPLALTHLSLIHAARALEPQS
jgi:GH15 family glucan-1,4-alpha-glucosidase